MPHFNSHHILGDPINDDLAAKLGLQPQQTQEKQEQVEEDLTFPTLPPFPNTIPTAPLLRINLAQIASNDENEQEKEIDRLFQACCDLGFFYLDVRGHDILSTADEMFQLGEKVFDVPLEEKSQFDFIEMSGSGKERSYFGYKGFGKAVADEEGRRDRNEFWNVSKDDLFGISERLPNSTVLNDESNREKMRTFMQQSHEIVLLILSRLEAKLELPPQTLQRLHRQQERSGDQIRWVKSPPQPPQDLRTALGAHTDFGSVTILFNRLGGLQVLPPGSEEWAYVKPLRGHCVVNMGDAMVKFTRGRLRSNVHRVVNPPGEQMGETRYSLVYFARPEDEVLLKSVMGGEEEDEGEVVTAKEWILRKAGAIRGPEARKMRGS